LSSYRTQVRLDFSSTRFNSARGQPYQEGNYIIILDSYTKFILLSKL
jgi:hypothetical protein